MIEVELDYITFKAQLLEAVQKNIGEDTRVYYESIPKNNGIFLDGMLFYSKERTITPIIYVKEFYEAWKKGIPMVLIVDKILESCRECEKQSFVKENFFRDYETMKPHIYYKLINYAKNQELLREVPHRRVLDLAMVFYYRMEGVEPMATIMIRNSHLHMWKITAEELEENACKYTYLALPAMFLSMSEVMRLEGMEGEERLCDDTIPMYVLTNGERQFGAGVMLYPGILQQAESLLGDDFYILPSSIHECILISGKILYSQTELSAIVAQINENHVDCREILSDQAYFYAKKDGRIEF